LLHGSDLRGQSNGFLMMFEKAAANLKHFVILKKNSCALLRAFHKGRVCGAC
jgi:hypothetical protein